MENPGIKYGLYGGLIFAIATLIFYLIDANFMMRTGSFITFLIYLNFMYLAGKAGRDLNGGFIGFRDVIKPTYTTYVIASLIGSFFVFGLMKMDSSLVDIQKVMTMEWNETILSFFGMGAEDIDEANAMTENQDFTPTIGVTFLVYASFLIIGFFFAAIISLILRRKGPKIA